MVIKVYWNAQAVGEKRVDIVTTNPYVLELDEGSIVDEVVHIGRLKNRDYNGWGVWIERNRGFITCVIGDNLFKPATGKDSWTEEEWLGWFDDCVDVITLDGEPIWESSRLAENKR